jgi:hypothetical protein
MVLVRMGQDQGVDAAVPWRDPTVEDDHEPSRVGAAVDQEPAATRTLDEDRVALADIEDGDTSDPRGPTDRHRAGDDDRASQERDRPPGCARPGTRPASSRLRWPSERVEAGSWRDRTM